MGYYDDALTKFEVFNSVIRMSKPYKSVDAIYADPLYMMSILQVVINYGILPNDSA